MMRPPKLQTQTSNFDVEWRTIGTINPRLVDMADKYQLAVEAGANRSLDKTVADLIKCAWLGSVWANARRRMRGPIILSARSSISWASASVATGLGFGPDAG